ncbi:MAG: hypothetical protein WCK28_09055 [Burkholderiales bacterium]|jgi:hypothetical protein
MPVRHRVRSGSRRFRPTLPAPAVAALIALSLFAGALFAHGMRPDAGPARLGAALFDTAGPDAPVGTLRHHETALPAAATRCANCHQDAAGTGPADAFGGRLDAARLGTAMPRRGGPAVAYDERSFCRLLRRGIDPNDIVISAAMPRYDVDAVQCGALWRHLSGRAS